MVAASGAALCYFCPNPRPPSSLLFSSSTLPVLYPSNPRSRRRSAIPQLGFHSLSTWSGLKHLGLSSRHYLARRVAERKDRCRGRVVYASLFGVGAPEALVIGVVALLVFGPKGLAEVARNLGKTLRAFQPTIRELQEVSRDFKNTLEREIGLDEVASSSSNYKSTQYMNNNQQAVADPNGKPANVPYSSEELLKVTEEQLASSATNAQPNQPASAEQPQASITSENTVNTSSEATASAAATETPSQIQSSEKAEGER
ncbi:sec-independent protein translocase protein TATB, chloroplastic isoform X2 [Ananas comosus]|uniref:Sec-independent protein translocase protein TATB, chloroplastic isoform X2 n=1 Tax=Ananas comosus TaxID=4615 RepID=A0A6P5F5G3_ANACO|nr:sec-independent protein translocase protein TATB, chloroplastic isoform X2 [Ananas comosus]